MYILFVYKIVNKKKLYRIYQGKRTCFRRSNTLLLIKLFFIFFLCIYRIIFRTGVKHAAKNNNRVVITKYNTIQYTLIKPQLLLLLLCGGEQNNKYKLHRFDAVCAHVYDIYIFFFSCTTQTLWVNTKQNFFFFILLTIYLDTSSGGQDKMDPYNKYVYTGGLFATKTTVPGTYIYIYIYSND